MSIIGSNILAGAAGQGGGYTIERSLRLRSSASAYLSRTPASAGNRQTWTWSAWVKRGAISSSTTYALFSGGAGSTITTNWVGFVNDSLAFSIADGTYYLKSTSVYRDPSAWYHITAVYDSTNATSANRIRLYVNGVQLLAFSTAIYPTQNYAGYINAANGNYLGVRAAYGDKYFDGYLTEVNFIDGQALTPSDFGNYNEDTGVWQPAKYAGTYGTNGFYLPFSDNTNTTTLAEDASGNGNNWTPNNISLTAGVTYDSMTDVPTLTDEDTANFAVLNPVNKGSDGVTLSDGNLAYSSTATTGACRVLSTIGMSTGKWYCEYIATISSTLPNVGIAISTESPDAGYMGETAGSYGYYAWTGNKYNNGSSSAYGATYNNGDVIGIAFDADAGSLTFYKNGTSQGVAFASIPGGTYYFGQGDYSAAFSGAFNFGQRPFATTTIVPTGYLKLNTFNLPDSSIVDGSENFDVALDTGAAIKATTEGLYTNQLSWIKDRVNANNNQLIDSVRGLSAVLQSNTTATETTYSAPSGSSVGWVWKAGGTAVTNTAGSITSQVSASPTAGFSVVTYTGTGAAATVGHGLGAAPDMVIIKGRSAATTWPVYHQSLGVNGVVYLETTAAQTSEPTRFNSTLPSSTVLTLGTFSQVNFSAITYVAYCFSEVPGYSKFGSYTGNGSSDGPFVFTGFRPAFVMIKNASSTGGWTIFDDTRSFFNVADDWLYANLSDSEFSDLGYGVDLLSSGIKLRHDGAAVNANGNSYIYMAFAENPFKNSLAR